MKSNNSLFLCGILFVCFNMLQTKLITKRILLSRHINPLPNRNTLYVRQNSRNCIDLGPKNIYCLINQGGNIYGDSDDVQDLQEIHKPGAIFIDLTRIEDIARSYSDSEDSFSEDYLDVNDLSFTRKVDNKYLLSSPNNHQKNIIKVIILNSKTENKSKSPRKQKSRKVFNLKDKGNGNVLRSRYSDSSDEESEEESSDKDVKENGEYEKPKRFEIVEKSDDEATSEELNVPPRVPGRTKMIYAQSPTRHLSVLNRRRLPHFLPKRYHWSLQDIQHLPYLWFNGPQGEYAGIFRITP